MRQQLVKHLFLLLVVCFTLGLGLAVGLYYYYIEVEMPDMVKLKDIRLQMPMQVFSQDGKLVAQFGEKRRIPMRLSDIPPDLINAFIATEDSRFYEHHGFDLIGIARATVAVIASGDIRQGASTITQQLARNLFLSNEKKVVRKIKEIFIAIHIEQILTKDEILELYLNKIYHGHRSYGVAAAAQVYFGKDVQTLTLGEMAMIAGLPKAPSTMNPIYSLSRATQRRNVVLSRMLSENYITQTQYSKAKAEPIVASYHEKKLQLYAPYAAEMARSWAVKRFGEGVYTSGMKIHMTVNTRLQRAANQAAIENLVSYDERHGYRGAVRSLWKKSDLSLSTNSIEKELLDQPIYGELHPAVVTHTSGHLAQVVIKGLGFRVIRWNEIKWARPYITEELQGDVPTVVSDVLSEGEQVWVYPAESDHQERQWHLSQVPDANTALVAIRPEDGAVSALVGGLNFLHSKFNRVTQSIRQVGSGIKPFIYSAALSKGMTLATLINDAPINQWGDKGQSVTWCPRNSPPTYRGPTRMRVGLAQSKNVMAIRAMREVGLKETRNYLTRFSFGAEQLPNSETIALGVSSMSPLKLAQGYAVFANGGYQVTPYFVRKVEDPFGNIMYQATPKITCSEQRGYKQYQLTCANRVVTAQNAFLVREMLFSNISGGGDWKSGTGWNGTGWRAQRLRRRDIGGKTGTTNDVKDTWYTGFGPGVVASVWVGFDVQNRLMSSSIPNPNMGKIMFSGNESGAKTAQPAWIEFMRLALTGTPQKKKSIPKQVNQVRIDRATGLLTEKVDESSVLEFFERGTEPQEHVQKNAINSIFAEIMENLF